MDMSGMEKLKMVFARALLKEFCQNNDIPEDIWMLVDSLVEAGCPVEAVLNGMKEFSERMAFKNLVEGMEIERDGYKKGE